MIILWQDIRHQTIERLDYPETAVAAALDPTGHDPRYPLLGGVDPYGTTLFNSFQMRQLLPEIRDLRAGSQSPVLADLERLAESCSSRPHSFLAFLGD